MPELHMAIGMYEKAGFTYLTGPLGKSGHFGCDLWMIKKLQRFGLSSMGIKKGYKIPWFNIPSLFLDL